MDSFYSRVELEKFGFSSFGENVLISKKASIYSPDRIKIGSNVRIDDFCILSGDIVIGNHVHIAAYSALFGSNGIELKDFSGISSRVTIYSSSDDYTGMYLTNPTVPAEYKKIYGGKVTLEKHVIVGASSVILPNVTLKEGSSIGAMTLITKDTKEWTIYFGIPAKELKARKKNLLELEQELLLKEVENNGNKQS